MLKIIYNNEFLNNLFSKSFFETFTKFKSWEHFIECGNLSKNFYQIHRSDLDKFISDSTRFADWEEFKSFAIEYYICLYKPYSNLKNKRVHIIA